MQKTETKTMRRFEVEAILVKKSAMHELGTNDDIDPDLDAAFVVDHRKSESQARICAENMFKQYEPRLMWNRVTIQEQVFGDDEGMPVWEPVGETLAYHGDRWE